MRRIHFAPVLALVALLIPLAGTAQDVGGFRGALLADLDGLEQKYMALAGAVAADDYDWRPVEGVRSIAEAYTHVAGGTYFYAGTFAEGRPADVGVPNAPENLEEVTDKEQVMALLEHAFDHARQVIRSTPDSELDSEVDVFGRSMPVRAMMLGIVTHMHEHLGQSIAYARSIGVAPPWSM